VTLFRSPLVARMYDAATAPLEHRGFGRWRHAVWSELPPGGLGLEVGAGTGANFAFHPRGARVIGMDISPAMLRRARAKPAGADAPRVAADVEALPFADATFDWAAETLVFCEVRDPVAGLRELRRVLRPGGCLVMLEHVRPSGLLGVAADALTTVTAPAWGEHFNRDAEAALRAAGFAVERREWLWRDGVVLLVGRSPGYPAADPGYGRPRRASRTPAQEDPGRAGTNAGASRATDACLPDHGAGAAVRHSPPRTGTRTEIAPRSCPAA
jgi:phosphatidylethanolamine/phosphatidyl-N-methylethanolamine N-methyltransferase